MDQLGQKFKIDFFFLNTYSFSYILVQHFFDIRHCVWECDHSTDNFITDLWKVDFQKFENLATLIAEIAIQKSIFTWKCCFYTSNPQSNLEIKYWRFQNMWNFKLDHGIIFWVFWLCIPVTQNQDFWQLIPFDLLSHILLMHKPIGVNFITDLWKVDFQKFENLATLIAEIAIQNSIFTWKCCFYIKSSKQLRD